MLDNMRRWIVKLVFSISLIVLMVFINSALSAEINIFPTDPNIISTDTTSGKTRTRVVSNTKGYLCVWEERINSQYDIYGRYVDTNGMPQGDVFEIAAYANDQKDVDVESDGNNYLVVWKDANPDDSSVFCIKGTLVIPGQNNQELMIEPEYNKYSFPKVEWNGNSYLVAWENHEFYKTDTDKVILEGRRVGANSDILDFEKIILESDNAFVDKGKSSKACFDIGSLIDPNTLNWFLVWSGNIMDPGEFGFNLMGKIILEDPNGSIIVNPNPNPITTSPSDKFYPSIEGLNDQYMIAWQDIEDTDVAIYGILITAVGYPTMNSFPLSPSDYKQNFPEVVSNNDGFFVIWKDYREYEGQTKEKVYGRRIGSRGLLLPDPSWENGIRIDITADNKIDLPAAASNRSSDKRYFCFWVEVESGCGSNCKSWTKGRIYAPPAPPRLEWLGEGDFIGDGVNPDTGPGGGTFTFKVKFFSDISVNLKPEVASKVWLDINYDGTQSSEEMFDMNIVADNDPNYFEGRIYTCQVKRLLFDRDGIMYYWFLFADKYNVATGPPTEYNSFTIQKVGGQPVLYWLDIQGYTEDATKPDYAQWREKKEFQFRILYEDLEGDPPERFEIWIDKNGDSVWDPNHERFEMDNSGNDPNDRIIFSLNEDLTSFNRIMPMFYKFNFDDGNNISTGKPTAGGYISFNPLGEVSACLNNAKQSNPSIVKTDKGFQAFWMDNRERIADPNKLELSKIWMEMFTNEGRVMDDSDERGQLKIDVAPKGGLKPIAQFDPMSKKTLIVWEDFRDGNTRNPQEKNSFKVEGVLQGLDIYGAFIDSDGNVYKNPNNPNPGGEFCITGSETQENMVNPDMAIGHNGKFLVVWEDETDIDIYQTDIYARFVKYPEGTEGDRFSLQTNTPPINFPGYPGNQIHPKVASNGEDYIVIWQDDIYYTKVDYDLDPNGLVTKVVDRIDPMIPYHSKLYGLRVNEDGSIYPPDQEGLRVYPPMIENNPNTIDQYFPSIASDSNNYLVVWQDNRNLEIEERGYDIYGMMINADFVNRVPEYGGIAICTAEGHQIMPRVFWDADAGQYLITWIDLPLDFSSKMDPLFLLHPEQFARYIMGTDKFYGTIRVARMDPNGVLIGEKSTSRGIAPVGVSDSQGLSCVTCEPDAGCMMIWEDIRNSIQTAYYDLYSAPFQSVIQWTDDPNFTYGLKPYQAISGSNITFKVEYRDRTDTPVDLNDAQVWIDIDANGVFETDEQFQMAPEDPNADLSQGLVYEFSKEIYFPGNAFVVPYTFHFENENGQVPGVASSINYISFDIDTNTPPVLTWTPKTGYINDGVEPNEGDSGDLFVFSVTYKDVSNIPPPQNGRLLYIDLDDTFIDLDGDGHDDNPNEYFVMSPADPNDIEYTNGKEYTFSKNISYSGDGEINYKFLFYNGVLEAEGEPASDNTLVVKKSSTSDLKWEKFTNTDGLAANYITSLDIDDDDNIWVGCFDMYDTSKGGISKYDNQNWTNFIAPDNIISNSVVAIKKLANNDIFAVTIKGISIYNGSEWDNFAFETSDIDPNTGTIVDISTRMTIDDRDGTLWFTREMQGEDAQEIDLRLIKYPEREEIAILNVLNVDYVNAIGIDGDGIIWTGVGNISDEDPNIFDYSGIILYNHNDNSIVERYNTTSGNGYDGGNFVYKIYKDHLGDMWVASIKYSIANQTITDMKSVLSHYSQKNKEWDETFINGEGGVSFGGNFIASICRKDDELWLGHYAEGGSGSGSSSYYDNGDSQSTQTVTGGGATYHDLSTNTWSKLSNTDAHDEAFSTITAIAIGDDNIVWFGTQNGLFRYNREGIDTNGGDTNGGEGEGVGPYQGLFNLNEDTGCFVTQIGKGGSTSKTHIVFYTCIIIMCLFICFILIRMSYYVKKKWIEIFRKII